MIRHRCPCSIPSCRPGPRSGERSRPIGPVAPSASLRAGSRRTLRCRPGWSDLPRTTIRGAEVRGPEAPGTPALSEVEGASPCGSGPRIGVRGGNVGVIRASTNARPLQFPPASSRRWREIRHCMVTYNIPMSFPAPGVRKCHDLSCSGGRRRWPGKGSDRESGACPFRTGPWRRGVPRYAPDFIRGYSG